MKKILALALVLCLALTAVSASAADLLSAGDTYPLNTDKTITWYVQDCLTPHTDFASWHDSPFHNNLMTLTGVNIEWSFPTTGSTASTFTNTVLADPSNLPDILGGYFTDNATQYLDDELIWDLTPYLEEYAPAYYHWLQTNETFDKAVKDDNGRYYSFGFFREDGGWNDSYLGPVCRQDWLDECGLEIPTTISELENVIRVFHEKYGAVFTASWTRFPYMGFAGAFGAASNCSNDVRYIFTIRDGEVVCDQTTDEWRAWATWFAKLYKEGLVDTDILTLDDTSVKTKVENGQSGVAITSMGQMNNWNKEMDAQGNGTPWIGIPNPTADDGSLSAIFGGPGIGSQTYVISKCADEETMKLCLQVLDYAYTQEGFMFWNYGLQAESYDDPSGSYYIDENGDVQYTALVAEDTSSDPLYKYNGAMWGSACIQSTWSLYLKNSTAAIEANNTWFYLGYGKTAETADMDEVLRVTTAWKWPTGATFTTDEADTLDLYTASLTTYLQEQCVAFLTGNNDITDDAAWESFKTSLEQYHLSDVLAIRQACYDRYASR